MSGSLNIIRKQTLHFQYNGVADGFSLQKEVSDWCNFSLFPEIEKQLNFFDPGKDFFRIDKLEIKAKIDSNDWKKKISNELIFNLKQQLSDYKLHYSETGEKIITKPAKLDELILFYFENGFHPWWGNTLLQGDYQTVFNNWISEEISVSRAEKISEHLERIRSENVINRIFNQIPQNQFFQFLKNIYKHSYKIIDSVESLVNQEILKNISSENEKIVVQAVFTNLLKDLIINKGKINVDSILFDLYKDLKLLNVSALLLKPKASKILQQINPVTQAWQKLLVNESEKERRQKNFKNLSGNELINRTKKSDKEISSTAIQNLDGLESEELRAEKKPGFNSKLERLVGQENDEKRNDELKAELQEGIFIDNAGAVIFAAFLPTLFKKLELEKNGLLVNPDLAAQIIQFCVSGNPQVEEYELVLPKILCGLDIEFPVNTNNKLFLDQITEVNDMLQSLIEYWSALKSTSLEGLRESFLNRNGKLSFVNNEWILVVEQKPFDMLLERIPWSISMIKLPWMTNILKTEWV